MHQEAVTNPTKDTFVPQCTLNGSFINLQCHGPSNECWCVDEQGRELTGTRVTEPLTCVSLGLYNVFVLLLFVLVLFSRLIHRRLTSQTNAQESLYFSAGETFGIKENGLFSFVLDYA